MFFENWTSDVSLNQEFEFNINENLSEAVKANQQEIPQKLASQTYLHRIEGINQKDEEVQHAQSERSVCQEGKLVL